MTKNDIKKALYKENPIAHLTFIRKGVVYYTATVSGQAVLFQVPFNDMGDADFTAEMEAKLLIRYLNNN